MRYRGLAGPLLGLGLGLGLAACASTPDDVAELTLNESAWDKVNVQVVVTRLADCDNRGEGYISTKELVMIKNKTETFQAPAGASICWRRDRDPNRQVAGAWTGWSRAVLYPGQNFKTAL